MMTGNQWAWIGGIAGSAIGLAGGIVGTYFSIRNTQGPRERSFMIKFAIVAWVFMLVFLALLFALPNPFRWLLWIPYAVFLPMAIRYGNLKQQALRNEESQQQAFRPPKSNE
jgi:Ca2+/Na+ antiporter